MKREDSVQPSSEDIFAFASEFDHPIVRKYAAELRNADVSLSSFDRPTIAQELIRCGIPEIPAGDIVDAFRAYRRRGKVGVYWDIENIPLPREVDPVRALKALRDKILETLGDIVEFKAYMDMQQFVQRYTPEVRVAFLDCGIQLIDAPHNERKEVADKQIIVDAMWFAQRTKDAIVCLMSGDSDFSPLLSRFRMDGIRSMVITSRQHVRSLREQATWVLVWPHHFLTVDAGEVEVGEQRNRRQPINREQYFGSSGRGASVSPSARRGHSGNKGYSGGSGGGGLFSNKEGNPTDSIPSPTKQQPKTTTTPKQHTPPPAPAGITSESVVSQPSDANNNNNSSTALSVEALPPYPVPFIEDEDDGADDPVVRDLVDCIRRVQRETGMKKVRRSAVGVYFGKLTNNVVTMREVVAAALNEQRVVIGGRMGHAWIALSSDGVNDDDPNATLPISEPSSTLTAAADANNNNNNAQSLHPTSSFRVVAAGNWYLSLRYNRRYRAYDQLASFTVIDDPSLTIVRLVESNDLWTRMAVGPFPTMQAADDYFQSHFSGMDLLYKVTNNLQMYYPSLAGGAAAVAEPNSNDKSSKKGN